MARRTPSTHASHDGRSLRSVPLWHSSRMRRILAPLARVGRVGAAPLPLLGLLAAIGPLALTSGSEPAGQTPSEIAYHALPELPDGSTDHTAEGVARTAIELAQT